LNAHDADTGSATTVTVVAKSGGTPAADVNVQFGPAGGASFVSGTACRTDVTGGCSVSVTATNPGTSLISASGAPAGAPASATIPVRFSPWSLAVTGPSAVNAGATSTLTGTVNKDSAP